MVSDETDMPDKKGTENWPFCNAEIKGEHGKVNVSGELEAKSCLEWI